MFFSIFGKKGESKRTKDPAPVGKTPIARQPANEDPSLDFSAYVPLPRSEPLRVSRDAELASQPQEAEPAEVAQPLDASVLASLLAAEVTAAAVVAPAGAVAVEPAPLPTQADSPSGRYRLDSVLGIDVSPAANDVAPVIEETATLFANGQAEQALATLSRSVREADLGASTLQAWLMLFDLYQHLGMKGEFEALALEFVVKFERSPPAWIESEGRVDPALATGGIGYCALVGTLSEASAPELEELRKAAGTRQSVRVDCSELQGVDSAGCGLLHEALLSLSCAGTEVMLTGEARLIEPLEQVCQPGRIETDGALWALLLDVYRMLDLKDKFEEAAVNYAVTFEVSPPSWERRAGGVAKPEGGSVEAGEQALSLSGEITAGDEALAKQMRDWAAAHEMLLIDMTGAKRVGPVTAGLMLNALTAIHQAGTTIQIQGANQLIHALFQVVGIGRLARIIPRK